MVFGGIPPEDSGGGGFSEWSHTVRDFPMPVRYSLASNLVLMQTIEGVTVTEADFSHAMDRYLNHALGIAKHIAKTALQAKKAKEAGNEAKTDETAEVCTIVYHFAQTELY